MEWWGRKSLDICRPKVRKELRGTSHGVTRALNLLSNILGCGIVQLLLYCAEILSKETQ
jgi:hypothetical protein